MRNPILLGDDRNCVGPPIEEPIAPLDLDPIVGEEPGTVWNPVPCFLPAGLVQQHDLGVPAHHHRYSGRIDDDVAVLDLDRCVEGGLDRRLLGPALRGTTNVEGAHGQLGAGLADRLRSDNADRLTDIDDGAARKVAAIAFAADTDARFTGQHRADRYRVDAGPLELVDGVLIDQPACRHHDFPAQRRADIDRRSAADNTVSQRSDDLPAVDNGACNQPARSAAILLTATPALRDI